MIGCLAVSIMMGLAGLWIYLYYWNKGQFEDEEDVKYQIFREEEERKNK